MKRVQAKNKAHLQDLIMQAFDEGVYDLNFIDTSLVTDMSELFVEIDHDFDVSEWDVSQVTNMEDMFKRCESFNQDLSRWDVSQVTNMVWMFGFCASFDQDLSQWDVSQVTSMEGMFYCCASFDQDISQWDISQVTDMYHAFYACESFDQDLSQWDVSGVTDMESLFYGCQSFDQDLSQWDVSEVTNFVAMFESAKNFDPAHIPQAFYQRRNIDPNIDLEQGIKDLIDTLDHTNLELALNLANNVDKLSETQQYIDKVLFDTWLFGRFDHKEEEAYKEKAQSIIQSL